MQCLAHEMDLTSSGLAGGLSQSREAMGAGVGMGRHAALFFSGGDAANAQLA